MRAPAQTFTEFEQLLMRTGFITEKQFNEYDHLPSAKAQESFLSTLFSKLNNSLQIINSQLADAPLVNKKAQPSQLNTPEEQSVITIISHPTLGGENGAPNRIIDEMNLNGKPLDAHQKLGQAILNQLKLSMSLKPGFTGGSVSPDKKLTERYTITPTPRPY